MPEPSDLTTLLGSALRQIGSAMKAFAFYPGQHPAVVAAFGRATLALREALARRDDLRVGVGEAAFLLDGEPLAADDRALAGFASFLQRRGIGVLAFRSPLDDDALRGLLDVIALDPATLKARGGPARCLGERRPGGVAIEEFDLAEALRAARTEPEAVGRAEPGAPPPSPKVTWNDLLARHLLGDEPDAPSGSEHLMRRIAGDVMAARELLASLQEASLGRPDRGPLLVRALQRIARSVAEAEPEALTSLAANLAASLSALDVEARMHVLQASLPVGGGEFDLARQIRAHLPDDHVGDLIVSMVRSEGKLNARLASVIRKVLTDKGPDEAAPRNMLEAIRAARSAGTRPPPDVWAAVEDLIKEAQDDWISREYKSLLELMGEQPPVLDSRTREEILSVAAVSEAMTPAGVAQRAWALFGDLLEVDREPARQWVALDQVEKRLAGMTPAWFGDCSRVVRSIRAVLDPPPPPHVAEAAQRALQAIGTRIVACLREAFHGLAAERHQEFNAALEEIGPPCVEPLLAALAAEEDWEIRRRLVGFLASRGRAAVPALLRRLAGASWYVVRNIVLILGEIADPQTIPAVAAALQHADARVRREAAAALGKIGGPRAFDLVRNALDDPEIGEVAMRALAAIDRPRTVGAFLERTDHVSAFGRGERQVRDAILALGELAASESVPRLESILMRRFWVPPWAGDALRIAAARALHRIGTVAALAAVEKGARLWRRPVQIACAGILGGRPAAEPGGGLN
jgi:HEAT repeat protein